MRNGEERMDELLRKRLEHYSVDPPEQVWLRIQSGIQPDKPSRRLFYYRWMAAAAVLLLAVISGIWILDKPEYAIQEAAEQSVSPGTHSREVHSRPEQSHTGTSSAVALISSAEPTPRIKEPLVVAPDDHEPDPVPIITRRENMTLLASIRTLITYDSYREELQSAVKRKTISADNLSEADQLIIAGNLQRQPGNDPEANQAWKVGLHLSPGYSSQSVQHSQAYALNMTHSEEDPQANVGAGFSVQYKTNSRWRIESGMYYARTGGKSGNSFQMGNRNAVYLDAHGSADKYFNTGVSLRMGQLAMNSTAGIIDFNSTPANAELISLPESSFGLNTAMLTPGEFAQVFDFVEIPLFARFLIIDSNLDVELVGGVSTNLVVGNNVFMESNGSRELVGTTRDISTMNFSGSAGIGLIYAIGKNVSLSLEPRINYYLNSINHSGEVSYKPWRVGVFTGVSYTF
jgi:hypothetical protein